jgi:hypothetical protein
LLLYEEWKLSDAVLSYFATGPTGRLNMFDRQWEWLRNATVILCSFCLTFLLASCDDLTDAAGARGATGPAAPQGAQEPPASAGSGASLALVDANGQLVGPLILSAPGILAQYISFQSTYVVVPLLGTVVSISLAGAANDRPGYTFQDALTSQVTAIYYHTAPDCSDPRLSPLQPIEPGFVWDGVVYFPTTTGVVDGGSIVALELVGASSPGQSFSQIGTCKPAFGNAGQPYGPLVSAPLPNVTPPFSIQIR